MIIVNHHNLVLVDKQQDFTVMQKQHYLSLYSICSNSILTDRPRVRILGKDIEDLSIYDGKHIGRLIFLTYDMYHNEQRPICYPYHISSGAWDIVRIISVQTSSWLFNSLWSKNLVKIPSSFWCFLMFCAYVTSIH